MLEHLEKTWDRCLCEAKQRLLEERLAARQEGDPYPELPTNEEAFEIARQLFYESQASAARIIAGRPKMV
jgi:hypothetical protein